MQKQLNKNPTCQQHAKKKYTPTRFRHFFHLNACSPPLANHFFTIGPVSTPEIIHIRPDKVVYHQVEEGDTQYRNNQKNNTPRLLRKIYKTTALAVPNAI